MLILKYRLEYLLFRWSTFDFFLNILPKLLLAANLLNSDFNIWSMWVASNVFFFALKLILFSNSWDIWYGSTIATVVETILLLKSWTGTFWMVSELYLSLWFPILLILWSGLAILNSIKFNLLYMKDCK